MLMLKPTSPIQNLTSGFLYHQRVCRSKKTNSKLDFHFIKLLLCERQRKFVNLF